MLILIVIDNYTAIIKLFIKKVRRLKFYQPYSIKIRLQNTSWPEKLYFAIIMVKFHTSI